MIPDKNWLQSKKEAHFGDWVEQFSLESHTRRKQEIPKRVLETVRQASINQNITTQSDVKELLKINRMHVYYAYAADILAVLTGTTPLMLPHEVIAFIRMHFALISYSFSCLQLQRYSFLNYSYVVWRVLCEYDTTYGTDLDG